MKNRIWISCLVLLLCLGGCGHKQELAPAPVESQVVQSSEAQEAVSSTLSESVSETAEPESTVPEPLTELSVHYIDVGQGAATLVLCDGEAMLIDGGRDEKGTLIQMYLKKQGVTKLKYVIGSHPDGDHVGGLDVAIYKFEPEVILLSNKDSDANTYRDVLDMADAIGVPVAHPEPGDVFPLGSAEFTVAGPIKEYEGSNNNSLVILLTHGEKRFLFCGDAEKSAEKDLVDAGVDLDADVYLTGHHGSASSTTRTFLEAMSPKYAVISCGEGNPYGHPHAEVLDLLRESGCKVFRTDEQGSVIVTSDGKTLTWNCAPSETWKPGEKVMAESEEITRGESETEKEKGEKWPTGEAPDGAVYVGNTRNQKLHLAICDSLPVEKNQILFDSLEEAERKGFTEETQCQQCQPFYHVRTKEGE